jgi:diguanylate cyclase (GGDEF)-like protein
MLATSWDDITGLTLDEQRTAKVSKFLTTVLNYIDIQESINAEQMAVEHFLLTKSYSDLAIVRKEILRLNTLQVTGGHPFLYEPIKDFQPALSNTNQRLTQNTKLPPEQQTQAAISLLATGSLQKTNAQVSSQLANSLRHMCETMRDHAVYHGSQYPYRKLDEGRLVFGVANLGAIGALFVMVFYYLKQRDRAESARKEAETKLRAANQLLETQANTDPLTGALNRRGLERELAVEIRRADRNKQDLSILLIDCDDFKAINEAAGHAGGDAVLTEIARRLKLSVRVTDLVARIGGDEFIVIFSSESPEHAASVAKRICDLIAATPITTPDALIKTTVSIALSPLPSAEPTIEEILEVTRDALLRSKNLGKNRVTCANFHSTRVQF